MNSGPNEVIGDAGADGVGFEELIEQTFLCAPAAAA